MHIVTEEYIYNQVKRHHCPYIAFCTVATTGYEETERRQMCTDCWKSYCMANGIVIVKKEDKF